MRRRRRGWALLLLVTGLGGGCASGGTINVWGQRWNIPYTDNTVGAELGIWPRKGLDLYIQWVTPRLVSERLLPVADESHRQRLSSLLSEYIVVRVVAVNHPLTPSPFFEYDRWSLLVGGQERQAVVPAGDEPTAERGYFVGSMLERTIVRGASVSFAMG